MRIDDDKGFVFRYYVGPTKSKDHQLAGNLDPN
jgi:hypothetical protein